MNYKKLSLVMGIVLVALFGFIINLNLVLADTNYDTNEFILRDWEKEGFQASQAEHWYIRGFTLGQAIRWRENYFSVEEAFDWARSRHEPGYFHFEVGDAVIFRDNNVGIQEATSWANQGYSASEAVIYINNRFSLDEASGWRNSLIPASEAVIYRDNNMGPELASSWKREGFSAHQTVQLIFDTGLNLEDAIEWRAYNFDVEQTHQWHMSGFEPHSAHDYRSIFRNDMHSALEWRNNFDGDVNEIKFFYEDLQILNPSLANDWNDFLPASERSRSSDLYTHQERISDWYENTDGNLDTARDWSKYFTPGDTGNLINNYNYNSPEDAFRDVVTGFAEAKASRNIWDNIVNFIDTNTFITVPKWIKRDYETPLIEGLSLPYEVDIDGNYVLVVNANDGINYGIYDQNLNEVVIDNFGRYRYRTDLFEEIEKDYGDIENPSSWYFNRFSPDEARDWSDSGFGVEDAREWSRYFEPREAQLYVTNNINLEDTINYKIENIDEDKNYILRGDSYYEVFEQQGVTFIEDGDRRIRVEEERYKTGSEIKAELRSSMYGFDTIRELYSDYGIDTSELNSLERDIRSGVLTDQGEINRRFDEIQESLDKAIFEKGLSSREKVEERPEIEFKDADSFDTAREYYDEGVDVNNIADWYSLGFSAEEAKAWQDAGVTPESLDTLRSRPDHENVNELLYLIDGGYLTENDLDDLLDPDTPDRDLHQRIENARKKSQDEKEAEEEARTRSVAQLDQHLRLVEQKESGIDERLIREAEGMSWSDEPIEASNRELYYVLYDKEGKIYAVLSYDQKDTYEDYKYNIPGFLEYRANARERIEGYFPGSSVTSGSTENEFIVRLGSQRFITTDEGKTLIATIDKQEIKLNQESANFLHATGAFEGSSYLFGLIRTDSGFSKGTTKDGIYTFRDGAGRTIGMEKGAIVTIDGQSGKYKNNYFLTDEDNEGRNRLYGPGFSVRGEFTRDENSGGYINERNDRFYQTVNDPSSGNLVWGFREGDTAGFYNPITRSLSFLVDTDGNVHQIGRLPNGDVDLGSYSEILEKMDSTESPSLKEPPSLASLRWGLTLGAIRDAGAAARAGESISKLFGWEDSTFARGWKDFFEDEVLGRALAGDWESLICESYIKRAPDSVAYVQTPDGTVTMGATISGERSGPIPFTNETINISDGVTQYLYKLSYRIQNPVGSDEEYEYDIYLYGQRRVKIAEGNVKEGNVEDATGQRMIVKYSFYRYDKACIEFKEPITLADRSKESEICNEIVQSDATPTDYGQATSPTTSPDSDSVVEDW